MRNRLSARSLHGGQGHHTALGDVRYRKRDTRPFVPLADADTLDGAQRASFLLQRVTSVRSLTDRAIERVDALIAAKARASASPRLLIENHNPHETVAALRDILAQSEGLYDRGVPVRLAVDKTQGGAVAHVITPGMLVLLAHRACRPYGRKQKQDGSVTEVDVRLSTQLASMYLDWSGEWRLPVLNGIASAPLLREDGGIHSAPGYDPESGMWVESIPSIEGMIPSRPAREEAAAALHLIRKTFRTFCFANAGTVFDSTGTAVVDTAKPPRKDESAFLAALLTAVCRPSLHLAPGVLLRAASMSGAGSGKGLLARCICIIAFGREPSAMTGGATGRGTGEAYLGVADGRQPRALSRQLERHRASVRFTRQRAH